MLGPFQPIMAPVEVLMPLILEQGTLMRHALYMVTKRTMQIYCYTNSLPTIHSMADIVSF